MLRKSRWAQAGDEPSIADLLSDPIAEALMQADGVDLREVLAIFRGLEGSCAAPASPLSLVLAGEDRHTELHRAAATAALEEAVEATEDRDPP